MPNHIPKMYISGEHGGALKARAIAMTMFLVKARNMYGRVRNQRSASRGRHGMDCKRCKLTEVPMVHGFVDQRYHSKKDRRARMPQNSREHHGPWTAVDRNIILRGLWPLGV